MEPSFFPHFDLFSDHAGSRLPERAGILRCSRGSALTLKFIEQEETHAHGCSRASDLDPRHGDPSDMEVVGCQRHITHRRGLSEAYLLH